MVKPTQRRKELPIRRTLEEANTRNPNVMLMLHGRRVEAGAGRAGARCLAPRALFHARGGRRRASWQLRPRTLRRVGCLAALRREQTLRPVHTQAHSVSDSRRSRPVASARRPARRPRRARCAAVSSGRSRDQDLADAPAVRSAPSKLLLMVKCSTSICMYKEQAVHGVVAVQLPPCADRCAETRLCRIC